MSQLRQLVDLICLVYHEASGAARDWFVEHLTGR